MRTNDLLRLALVFLARRKTRTFLTILGVVIGTVCIVLMLSIGVTNYAAFRDMIEGQSSLTEIQVYEETQRLTQGDIEEMRSIQNVVDASGVLEVPGRLQCGIYEAYVSLTGVEGSVLQLQMEEGEIFDGSSAGMPQLVIGGNAVRSFVDPRNPPNYSDWEAYEAYSPNIDWLDEELAFCFGYELDPADEEQLSASPEVPMRVSGVTKKTNNMQSDSIYLDLAAAKQILMQNAQRAEAMNMPLNTYRQAMIRVDSMDNVAVVLEQVRSLGFDASSDVEWIEEMRSEESRQLLQLLLIGLVSLLVSAIGIGNTMYAGILERRRDIGILKVLGMKTARIRRLFLTEAVLIGLLGGMIGLLVSIVIVSMMNAGMESGSLLGVYFAEDSKITIPFWVGGGAVLTACVTAAAAGQWPAAKAARMSALDAMRTGR